MYSPRSVSTGSMPFAARCSLRPISSAIIDLPLVTVFAPTRRQMPRIDVARLRRGLGVVHLAAGGAHLLLVGLEVEVEMGERVVLDVARRCRAAARTRAARRPPSRRLSMKPARTWPSAFCSCASASACLAFSLKAGEVISIALSPPRRSAARRSCRRAPRRHGGSSTGDVLALQLARHVHQAAEIAGEQRAGAGRGDRRGLLLDDGVGDVGILDAERAAEAAADVGVRQLGRASARRRISAAGAAGRGRRARAGPSRSRDR